jgi:ABC-type dipeptide/oligopeptide/nickel transport system permease component
MLTLLARRAVRAVVVLVGVSLMVFFSLRLVPGDPAILFAGERATERQIEDVRERLGLDRSIPAQYRTFVTQAVQGDLGESIRSGRPVSTEIAERLPRTVLIAALALLFSVMVGFPLGLAAALYRGRWPDKLSIMVALIGVSAPTFLVAALLQLEVSVRLGWLPVTGSDSWQHMILPAVALGVFPVAIVARLLRANVGETLDSEFIRTAEAFGYSRSKVVLWHALKPSLIPTVTMLGLLFGQMLSVAVFVEVIFAWPGIGRYLVDSIAVRDYPAIQGVLLTLAASYVIINLIVDVIYRWLDPRTRA